MEPVLVELKGNVATITLNRPEKLNALDSTTLRALAKALERVTASSARVLVLRGSGRAFCAGQDLEEAGGGELDYEAHLQLYNQVFLKLRSLPLPVLAAVNGVAAGAGMSLALAADLRLLSESAVFITAFSRIGLAPDTGMTYTLPRLVGWARAYELLALSPEVSAAAALQMGLANRVVPDGEFDEAVADLAAELSAGPTLVYALIKRALDYSAAHDMEQVLDFEARLQKLAGSSRDHREGLAAFAEKRPPEFNGE